MIPTHDALALVEVDSVATGLRALDALVKQAPVAVLEANLVEPGRFLLLFAGGVAEVEEGYGAALAAAGAKLLAKMLLPSVHSGVLAGLRGEEQGASGALGVIEGRSVAATLEAADRSLKDAEVALVGLRVAGGLGGRAYYVVTGEQHDVEAAIAAGAARLDAHGALHATELIARPHDDMVGWLLRPPPFILQR